MTIFVCVQLENDVQKFVPLFKYVEEMPARNWPPENGHTDDSAGPFRLHPSTEERLGHLAAAEAKRDIARAAYMRDHTLRQLVSGAAVVSEKALFRLYDEDVERLRREGQAFLASEAERLEKTRPLEPPRPSMPFPGYSFP